MHKHLYENTKNTWPYLVFSIITGFFSAIIITIFKLLAELVVHLSGAIYSSVRVNPVWLPVLVLGAAAIGLGASLILKHSRSCRGGGIPTSVAAIRGIVSLRWFASIFILPCSALLTFLCGLPLGTEGPCVQMGTGIGEGVLKCFGNGKHMGWRRYVMTAGASAGFSIATASPVTAVLFSVEELHKRFSPLLILGVSLSVLTAQITTQLLAILGIGSAKLFHMGTLNAMPLELLYTPLIIGAICGICSVLITRFYHFIDRVVHDLRKKVSTLILFPVLFAAVSLIGFFLADTLGTGHSLVDKLLTARTAWYLLILVFLIRAAVMLVSNTSGVTGGLFLPTLAFGAILGALCGEILIAAGILPSEAYTLTVVLGITAFLGSTSRIPVTACIFAVEALGGGHNILAVLISTTVAYLIAEFSGLDDFTDTVIEAKMRAMAKGKKPNFIRATLTVSPNSLAVGKKMHDILWPSSCEIISFARAHDDLDNIEINAGDVITVRYKTYDPSATADEFKFLVGEQSDETNRVMNP